MTRNYSRRNFLSYYLSTGVSVNCFPIKPKTSFHPATSRINTSASMMSKQINVISTHIHNLELAQTGSVAELPTGDELTEAAVNAEEMLEQLSASDELVSSLEMSMADTSLSDDEAAILKELEGNEPETTGPQRTASAESASARTEAARREKGQAQAE